FCNCGNVRTAGILRYAQNDIRGYFFRTSRAIAVMVATPVCNAGSGTGAKRAEWALGSCGAPGFLLSASLLESATPSHHIAPGILFWSRKRPKSSLPMMG